MTYQPEPAAPIEDVNRGTVLALLAIPAGIIVFVLIWRFGFIASAVTLGVAYLTMFLYMRGSGGVMGRAGAVRVALITIVTAVLSIAAGIVADVAFAISSINGANPLEVVLDSTFAERFTTVMSLPGVVGDLAPSVMISLAFAALGCFSILRNAFKSTAVASPAPGATWTTQPTQPGWSAQQPAQPWSAQQPAQPDWSAQQPAPPADDTKPTA